MNDKLSLVLFLIIILAISIFINYRFLDITYLSFRSIDEYAFHGSLLNMYEGVKNTDLQSFFSFKFYSYGFGFFLTNLLADIPAFASGNTEMAIFIPRMVTAVFAIISLIYVYSIASSSLPSSSSLLLLLLYVTVPAFFRNAAWFHPDWMMTSFILLSVFFFHKDLRSFKKYYWYGIAAFALSTAVKVQAIVFLPFILSYVFFEEASSLNFHFFKMHLIVIAKSIVFFVLIFIILNPYLLHPKGFQAFIHSFSSNMESNATNHGSYSDLTVFDKLDHVIQMHYFSYVLFAGLMFLLLYYTYRYFRNKSYSVFYSIAIFGLVNILYLLFFVNKDWQHYYLPVIMVALLLLIPVLNKLSFRLQWLTLSLLICFQVFYFGKDYSTVLTHSFKDNSPVQLEKEEQMNSHLIKTLQPVVAPGMNILISPYTALDYKRLGLNYNSIHIIWGDFSKDMIDREAFVEKSVVKDVSKFKEKNFILLRKDQESFSTLPSSLKENKNETALLVLALYNGSLGYELFSENDEILVFRKKGKTASRKL